MDPRTETAKAGTGSGLLPSDQNTDRSPTTGVSAATHRRPKRKRTGTEKTAKQTTRGARKTSPAFQKVLRQTPGGYFKPPKSLLPKTLSRDFVSSAGIQTATKGPTFGAMGTPAHPGGDLSTGMEWDVQWVLQQRLDECRRQCRQDVTSHFIVNTVEGPMDVLVPPEPFAQTRQSLDTLVELL